MTSKDLEHRDWLLFSTQKMIQRIDPKISVKIIPNPNVEDGKLLIVSEISETSIGKLFFLTNTDQNNNYFHLESQEVFLKDHAESIHIPGLDEIALEMFRDSDTKAFISEPFNKTHAPFSESYIKNATNGIVRSYPDLVDKLTSIIPNSIRTYHNVKKFKLVFNPNKTSASSL
jgi:hypothetical protein